MSKFIYNFVFNERFFVMDLLRIFRMQEPVSKSSLLTQKEDVGHYKEVVQEKDVLIRNNKEKIRELETEITELKTERQNLQMKLKASTLDENGFHEIMISYDDFFQKIWKEREDILSKNAIVESYLENLECSYHELLEKFQKAKDVIFGLKRNQDLLVNELDEYKEIIEVLEHKYESLRIHSEKTIADANVQLDEQQQESLEEIAKLKSKVVQRQAKINELEKQIKVDDHKPLYVPLRNRMVNK
ncbi:transforming acidic coiled-coil-containing protein 3-like isoform X2 [Diabrotica virgifera virgifera]|uniref:Transforming acidic coiled-coil-containing protein 3-like isoform X2 n=1 Tax=Diabrotica virgifera virgifera TaxID=50390 RepID=A0A6P7FK66_DIAVI|nr:transforming acidic coiled-coil-containing protein 3-like isoform X2 [Diabrotica virgifera virgifera]